MREAKKQVLGPRLKMAGWVLGGLLALLLVLLWMAGRSVTAERLVEEVEDSLNARLEIGEVEVELLRLPSRVVLRRVRLGERDEWVGRPLAERPALGEAAIEVGEVRLEVSLPELLFRKIDVKELVLVAPKVGMVIDATGSSNMVELFRSPPDRKERRKKKGKRSGGALNVEEIGMLGQLEGVRMLDGEADLLIEKSGMVIWVRELSAWLDAIEVDPAALEKTNQATLRLEGKVTLGWTEEGRETSGFLDVAGTAAVKLFDPVSADLDPEIAGRLTLGEESYLLAQVPPVSRTWAALGKLADWGMKIGGLPERATFGRGATVGVHYHQERFTAQEPLSLELGEWELAVLAESWLDLNDEEHEVGVELLASNGVSGVLHSGLLLALDYLPDAVEPEVVAGVEKAWFREGRLLARVRSQGELGDPEVDVLNKFPDVKEMTKEALERHAKEKLKKLGKGLLEGLLGGV
ncbi:MAG: hypothetical protein O3A92_16630, partial [Verrucomicrobia bacterium]|nr:hypothetical protein [Verrucomicrobiota bacterium]